MITCAAKRIECLFQGHVKECETEFRFLENGSIEYWGVCSHCRQRMTRKFYIDNTYIRTWRRGRTIYHDWTEVK